MPRAAHPARFVETRQRCFAAGPGGDRTREVAELARQFVSPWRLRQHQPPRSEAAVQASPAAASTIKRSLSCCARSSLTAWGGCHV